MFDGLEDALDYMVRDQALMSAATNYFAWQARLARPWLGRRVLEVGCGTGNFTRHLLGFAERGQRPPEWLPVRPETVIAVDHEAGMLARLRDRLGDPGNLITAVVDAEQPDSIAAMARFEPDSCVCLNVLEHVRDDRGALRGMARAMRPGSTIVLIVPAFPALYGPIDRKLGHFRRYTRTSLASAAESAGLRVREMRYFNAAGFFGWWLNARVARRTAQSAAQIAVFDRWIAPMAERVEMTVNIPFGQSLFAVLSGDES